MNSTITAINKYQSNDSDVLVFSKIMKNEIDEEFRLVVAQLKKSLPELLKVEVD